MDISLLVPLRFAEINDMVQLGLVIIFFVGPVFASLVLVRQALDSAGPLGTIATGGLSRLQKGIGQQQAKYRAGKRQEEWGRFKSGRKGGALNKAVGERVGTFLESENKGRLLFGGRAVRREALATQRKLNEARWGQTERAKAIQEDDGRLQAETYLSEQEARDNLAADFGMSAPDIDRAVAAVKANGGFSRAKANYAARRLVATGTGYANIEQMHRTVQRVASNESEAADLLGEMNAVTKGVGRHDLAAGFGNQLAMYRTLAARGPGANMTADEQREMYTHAFKDIDAVTLMRDKKVAVQNMSTAAAESFTVAQAAGDDAEAARLAGAIAKAEQSGSYASVTNIEEARVRMVAPTRGGGVTVVPGPAGAPIAVPTDGRRVIEASGRSQAQINPETHKLETIYERDPSTGDILIDSRTGRPIVALNPARNEPQAEIYRAHAPQAPNDPNHPNAA